MGHRRLFIFVQFSDKMFAINDVDLKWGGEHRFSFYRK